MTPTASRPPRWAQAAISEPEIDHHDERVCLVLRLLAGAFGAAAMDVSTPDGATGAGATVSGDSAASPGLCDDVQSAASPSRQEE